MKQKRLRVLILILVGILLIISGCVYALTRPPKLDTTGYKVIDNVKVNVYSKAKVKEFIESMNGKLITNNNINTKKLGEQEVKFIYENENGQERMGVFNIDVVDEEKPLVWLSSSYSTPVGTDINFEEEIFCADNYDSNPTCKVEGTYDINTPGSYKLTYVAVDSSNNETRLPFTLNVYEPTPPEPEEENAQPEETPEQQEEVSTAFHEVVEEHKDKDTEIGIDVSKWQGDINFKKVKKAGATFVMIRVGSQQGVNGEYILDPYFKTNVENATKNGLKVGVYFYSYADSKEESKKQADWVLDQIKDYNITLPVAFDWECYNNFNEMELSIFGLNEVAESFLDTVEDAGYAGMLYGSKNYLNSIWKYHSYDVWLAHYTEKTDYDSHYVMWQLCQDGKIDGIDTAVDINILYKNDNKK